jgi:hypothetical protein
MKFRCENPKCEKYPDYGGRGIRVLFASCAEFLAEVGPAPSLKHSIDRIDNDGHYAPGNVKWSTAAEQSRNTRRSRMITYDGVTQCLTDWAKQLGISQPQLHKRLRTGWPLGRALTEPPAPRKR